MTERRMRGLGSGATLLGVLVLLVAAAWWWVVFRQLVLNAYLTAPRALPCMVGDSVVCRLAQALCTSDHFLGIRRYYVEISWIGLGLLGAGLTARVAAGATRPASLSQRRLIDAGPT